MPPSPVARRRVLVTGIVQGVGFRPFVHRLARQRGLTGFVRNTGEGVVIEVQGALPAIDGFVDAVRTNAPPLARVQDISTVKIPVQDSTAFEILQSQPAGGRSWLPPDVGLCDDCRRELHDPGNRRYRHPFITCTNCGPRYTIIRALPYDRSSTTMDTFELCGRCRGEYADPEGRRFHAESLACLECGPRVWFTTAPGEAAGRVDGEGALSRALDVVASGGIVAVKGVGGFHLMCDAANAEAVARLRRRKQRPHKPFAIVVADLYHAGRVSHLSSSAAQALGAPARAIVLVDARDDSDLAVGVAPNLAQVGVMLPHSPLHDLLVQDWAARAASRRPGGSAALVMTSGNRAEEPVVIDADEAWLRLSDAADASGAAQRPSGRRRHRQRHAGRSRHGHHERARRADVRLADRVGFRAALDPGRRDAGCVR